MLAQIVIYYDPTLLPWHKLLFLYLYRAAPHYFQARLLAIQERIETEDFFSAQTDIEKVKQLQLEGKDHKIEITDRQQAGLFYFEARCNEHNGDTPENAEQTVRLLTKSVELYFLPKACWALAQYYDGFNKNFARQSQNAIHYLQLAAKGNSPEAAYNLALKFQYGIEGILPSRETAQGWYEKATAQEYPPACASYALFLLEEKPVDTNLDKILHLLSIAKKTLPENWFLYIQLKLSYLNQKEIILGQQMPLKQKQLVTEEEAKKYFKKLQWLAEEETFSNADIQFLSAIIQEYLLNNLEVAIDHYRAAAEYGSEIAHEKLYILYIKKITQASPESQRFHITSLTNVLDSRKFFFGIDPPDYLSLKQDQLVGELKKIAADFKQTKSPVTTDDIKQTAETKNHVSSPFSYFRAIYAPNRVKLQKNISARF